MASGYTKEGEPRIRHRLRQGAIGCVQCLAFLLEEIDHKHAAHVGLARTEQHRRPCPVPHLPSVPQRRPKERCVSLPASGPQNCMPSLPSAAHGGCQPGLGSIGQVLQHASSLSGSQIIADTTQAKQCHLHICRERASILIVPSAGSAGITLQTRDERKQLAVGVCAVDRLSAGVPPVVSSVAMPNPIFLGCTPTVRQEFRSS